MLSFGTNEGRCGHWLHPCDTPLNAEVTIKGQTCWLQCLQFLGVCVVFDGEFRIATLCGDDFWIGDSTGEKPIDVTGHGVSGCAEVAGIAFPSNMGRYGNAAMTGDVEHISRLAPWCGKQSQLRGDGKSSGCCSCQLVQLWNLPIGSNQKFVDVKKLMTFSAMSSDLWSFCVASVRRKSILVQWNLHLWDPLGDPETKQHVFWEAAICYFRPSKLDVIIFATNHRICGRFWEYNLLSYIQYIYLIIYKYICNMI